MAAGRQGPGHDRMGPRSPAVPARVHMPVMPSPVIPATRRLLPAGLAGDDRSAAKPFPSRATRGRPPGTHNADTPGD